MSQPGFPQQPGVPPQRGFPGQPGFPQHPGFQPPPGHAPSQPWNQPRPHVPPQPGTFAPGWQPPRPPRRKRSPLLALAVAAVVLVGLLAHAFQSQPSDDLVVTDYHNEDYVLPRAGETVSRIPIPEYESDIAEWLEDNPLYAQQLAAPVRCDVAPITRPASLGDEALQTRMRGYVECLTRVWGPALEAAGHEAYQPTLYVYPAGGQVSTSCGTQESLNAFYCGADQNLYLAADILRILPSNLAAAPEAYDLIIAHEFGHAVQGRSGLFAAFQYVIQEAGSESEALETSRRSELQADCFAGAAINSVADGMGLDTAARESVAEISYEIGDDRLALRFNAEPEEGDHGIAANRRAWAERGLSGASLSSCNTFVAPDSEVG